MIRMRPLYLTLSLLLLACAGGSPEEAPAPDRSPATVEVENRNFLDMTVYVVDGGVRQRLGVAQGNSVTALAIPERLLRGRAAPLRFFCDPIGGEGLPVTEEIMVGPGDTVRLLIPPG